MASIRNPRSNDGGVASSIRHGVENAADVAGQRMQDASAALGTNIEELEERLRSRSMNIRWRLSALPFLQV